MTWETDALIANHSYWNCNRMQLSPTQMDPSDASDANDGVSTMRNCNVWRYKNVQHNARLSVSSVNPACSSAR